MAHCTIPDIPLGERLTYTMGEAAGLLGISVATAYEERARGRLQTIKLAGRRLSHAKRWMLMSPQHAATRGGATWGRRRNRCWTMSNNLGAHHPHRQSRVK
jgi:hypothetical protein